MPLVQAVPKLAGQRMFTLGSAILCVLVGATVLAKWQTEPAGVFSVANAQPIMRAVTAACFVMSGLSLLLFQLAAWRPSMSIGVARFLAYALSAMASAMLVLDVVGWDIFGSASVLPGAAPDVGQSLVPMSGAAALTFMLIGAAMVLMLQQGSRLWLGQSMAASAFLISLLSLLALVFGADINSVVPFSSMTVTTAILFLALGAGLLTLRGANGWVSEFFRDTPSARVGRRYLVSSMLALPVIAQLRIVGERDLNWYDTYFGVAILTVGAIAILAFLNWTAVHFGNIADRQLDHMLRVNRTLSGINTLIVRVRAKDELFRETCRIAVELGGFRWAWIATTDPQSGRQVLQACHGGTPELQGNLDDLLQVDPQNGGSMLQQAVSSRRPVHLTHVRTPPESPWLTQREVELLRQADIRSLVVLPLLDAGKVTGVLALHSEVPEFFDQMEMGLLEELAGDIAFAIHHIDKDTTLNYLALYDPLTDLPNRTLFMERLGREMLSTVKRGGTVTLVLGNVQRFRMVNESFGRHVGDELLRQLASRLKAASPYPDNLSRISADSFACFLPTEHVSSLGHEVQQMFDQALLQPFHFGGQAVTVEVTVAVAICPTDGIDGETLMANAERALRKAKATQSPFMYYEAAMNAKVAETLKLEHRLRNALEQGQLELHYQPKVDFVERGVHSVEALMRWRDPERGLIPPVQFIPLMEEIGLIRQAGAWALRQAVTDMQRWRAMGLQVPRCAVNVSPIQLRSPDFASTVIDAIAECGGTPLDIEITESLLMQDVMQTSDVLQALQNAGVHIAVDDFGTGYSSLAYLARLPINALKIDRAFVTEMGQSEQGVTIVASIISLAHSLKLVVIAEGVETEEQAAILQSLRCDLMQGYLFSKPVPFDALAAMLPPQSTNTSSALRA